MRDEATGRTGQPREERLKRERPRDELGRPQPWEAENTLEMEDFDALPLEENHRLGVAHFNAGRYFPAHEAWETAWKQARDSADAEFFKGLSQMGAGYVHLLRGNAHGAQTLLRRAAGRIGAFADGHLGIRTGALRDKLLADASRVERGALVPGEDVRFAPPDV